MIKPSGQDKPEKFLFQKMRIKNRIREAINLFIAVESQIIMKT